MRESNKAEGSVSIKVSAKRVTQAFILLVLFITFASFVVRFVEYMWGDTWSPVFLSRFDVGEEASIPTWFSSLILLISSILLAVIAIATKRRVDRYSLHWAVLSIIFLILSIDEVIQVHELGGRIQESVISSDDRFTGFIPESSFIAHSWVVPGAIFVLIVGLAYLPFLAHLPRLPRRLFLLGGTLYGLGALGLETLSQRVIYSYGRDKWQAGDVGGFPKALVGVQGSVEELLEMLGVVVFIYALLLYASYYVKQINIRIQSSNK
jgi:hypothetical protein